MHYLSIALHAHRGDRDTTCGLAVDLAGNYISLWMEWSGFATLLNVIAYENGAIAVGLVYISGL